MAESVGKDIPPVTLLVVQNRLSALNSIKMFNLKTSLSPHYIRQILFRHALSDVANPKESFAMYVPQIILNYTRDIYLGRSLGDRVYYAHMWSEGWVLPSVSRSYLQV